MWALRLWTCSKGRRRGYLNRSRNETHIPTPKYTRVWISLQQTQEIFSIAPLSLEVTIYLPLRRRQLVTPLQSLKRQSKIMISKITKKIISWQALLCVGPIGWPNKGTWNGRERYTNRKHEKYTNISNRKTWWKETPWRPRHRRHNIKLWWMCVNCVRLAQGRDKCTYCFTVS